MPPEPSHINLALALLGSFSPRAAFQLRCDVSKRSGRGHPSPSTTSKYELTLAEAEKLMVVERRASLDAMRSGLAAVVGAPLLTSLAPETLAARLLGWSFLLPDRPRGVGGFYFDAWDDEDLQHAYELWFRSWTSRLLPAERAAFLLLAFGACVGPPLKRRTYLIPSAAPTAIFVPEASPGLWTSVC